VKSKRQKIDIPPPDEIKINPNSIVIYRPRQNFTGRAHFDYLKQVEETTTTKNNFKQPRSNKTNGFLSDRAGSRLRRSIKYLLWLSGSFKIQNKKIILKPSGHISFITLTLCFTQHHSDNFIKKACLNQFFTELNRKYPSIQYIWRAEKQKNGNIHFHILTNHFVPWAWIAQTWNRLLKKIGYLQQYQQKFSSMSFEDYCQTIQDYKINERPKYKLRFEKGKKENWSNPPSTHVEDMRTAKEIVYYMSKYLTKNSYNPEKMSITDVEKYKIEGRQYYCSAELSKIKAPTDFLSNAILREVDFLKKVATDRFFWDDFICVIRLPIEEIFNLGCFVLYNMFIENLNSYKPKSLFSP
jgi:hypothetical protein